MRVDWSEFLKNERGKESMDRLLLLLSFLPATIITAKICTVEALGVYLGSYGLVMANAKWAGRNASIHSQELETGELRTGGTHSDGDAVEDKQLDSGRGKARTGRKRPF